MTERGHGMSPQDQYSNSQPKVWIVHEKRECSEFVSNPEDVQRIKDHSEVQS